MNDPAKAIATQLKNLEARSGKTLAQLHALVDKSGLGKHGQVRDMLKKDLGLGHGDANLVAALYFKAQERPAAADADPLDAIYAGPKAALRPIHEKLVKAIGKFGDFEVAPKKAYVSLRRKKQFAMIGPGTKTRVDVGLNMKGVPATDRLVALPAGGMCQYRVAVTDPKQVDAELLGWIRQAWDAAG
jgi:hypothetical protein